MPVGKNSKIGRYGEGRFVLPHSALTGDMRQPVYEAGFETCVVGAPGVSKVPGWLCVADVGAVHAASEATRPDRLLLTVKKV